MGEHVCLLVTILYTYDYTLRRCAIKINRKDISDDCIEKYMEPENRIFILNLLPMHIRTCGPVVNVEKIDEVCLTVKSIGNSQGA